LSEALGWPPDYLATVLQGGEARPYADEQHDSVLRSLDSIEQELVELRKRVDRFEGLRERVDRIERRLADEDG
jgi:hypothetical protein